jgi:hypothetical protein
MAQLNKAFIVDSNYIKTNYPGYVEANIDNNAIESFILIAQDINLQSNIGYTMYDYIITNLIQDPTGGSLSTYYQYILINYIQQSVALWSIYNMLPTILYRATNKALVTKHSDESNATGLRELEYIRDQVRNNAQFYDSRIREYITNNVNFFQEYFSTSGVNRIRPKSNVYYGGLYLNNKNRKGGYGYGGNSGCCNDYPQPIYV